MANKWVIFKTYKEKWEWLAGKYEDETGSE
jgi:hypothetical protein